MKKYLCVCFALLLLFFSACTPKEETELSKQDPTVARTFEKGENGDDHTWVTYYEMSDGTWQVDGHTYKYRLEITGRLHNAVVDSTYVYLSNLEEITFEQAWKASGLSSDSNDYFQIQDAVLVEMN